MKTQNAVLLEALKKGPVTFLHAYLIRNKDGSYWFKSLSLERSGCVYMWTGGFKSENCKGWKAAKKAGVKIVKVRIDVL